MTSTTTINEFFYPFVLLCWWYFLGRKALVVLTDLSQHMAEKVDEKFHTRKDGLTVAL